MRERLVERVRRALYIVGIALVLSPGIAYATDSSSTHYSVSQVEVGNIGRANAQDNCSTGYCADVSVGDAADGPVTGTAYSAMTGALSSDTPSLTVTVTGGVQNLGVLSSSTTGTASYGVAVSTYLAQGYTLFIAGASPSFGSHHLKTLDFSSCPCTSQPGAEQFGINLRNNTTPNVGADVAETQYGFGFVAGDTTAEGTNTAPYPDSYNTPDLFGYADGDAIAGSNQDSGETDYTISMILNISGVTPAGHYAGNYSAIAVPLF